MEEGDVNAPSAEAIIRQILYGNNWFRNEFGKASAEYMLPDCFGFPASLPTILAHSGVKGFSTQKLVWGSSADGGGQMCQTAEGTPFNVGVWVGPDGETVLAGIDPGRYNGDIETDLSTPLPAMPPNPKLVEVEQICRAAEQNKAERDGGQTVDPKDYEERDHLREQRSELTRLEKERDLDRFQGDWAAQLRTTAKSAGCSLIITTTERATLAVLRGKIP